MRCYINYARRAPAAHCDARGLARNGDIIDRMVDTCERSTALVVLDRADDDIPAAKLVNKGTVVRKEYRRRAVGAPKVIRGFLIPWSKILSKDPLACPVGDIDQADRS
jgi:hypothetical protein